jgi:hypothetical protein
MVTVETINAEDLQQKIQEAKDAGKRVLALSPAGLKKIGRLAVNFVVISYTLVTQ